MSDEPQFTAAEVERLRALMDAFDEKEIEQLRAMVLSDSRTVWFWATIKVWATWIAAVTIGITLGWDALKKLIVAIKP